MTSTLSCGFCSSQIKRGKWCSESCRLKAHRRAKGLWTQDGQLHTCPQCSQEFTRYTSTQAYCSRRCGWLYRATLRPKSSEWASGHQPALTVPCSDCGTTITTRARRQPLCAGCRASRTVATNRRKNAKRRGARLVERFTVTQVGDRDGWLCHLCNKQVDRTLPGTDQRGPTIDHLIPIADGGADELANVALAHRACNVLRRNRGRAQLRLIG